MSVLKYQSNDELIRVMDEWVRLYCPLNVVKNSPNITKIGDHCIAKHGVVSIGGLTEAAHELGAAHLDLIPEPKEPTEAEKAAKLEAKMRKDYANSIAPQSTLGRQKANQAKAEAEKKAANQKEFANVVSQIECEINNYSVGHASGVLDYSRTESGRATLRGVRDGYDRRSIEGARAALSAVRTAKNKLS
jgi:hypothetical protein